MRKFCFEENNYECHRRWKRLIWGFFYCKPVYVGNGCVEYDCMELKDDNKVGKMFFIFSQFSSKGSIKLHAIVALKEIYALLRKPRYAEEIIALMCDQWRQQALMKMITLFSHVFNWWNLCCGCLFSEFNQNFVHYYITRCVLLKHKNKTNINC